MAAPFEILIARIETLDVDAVVNAANKELMPGTGVDGAIRAAAGAELTQLTNTLAPLDDGEARLTPGFKLSARHIIHTAAPIWTTPGEKGSKVAGLAACYQGCIAAAGKESLTSIAFPCLGTGNFGRSLMLNQSVLSAVGERIPVTMSLALLSLVITLPIGIVLGILAAYFRGTWIDAR